MKKLLLTGLFCTILLSFSNIQGICEDKENANKVKTKAASSVNSQTVKKAISAYKAGDYLSCISTLNEYTVQSPENAVAWYYLGSSYMNIAMIQEATAAFDKVIALNTNPKLTSYAIQAQLCMKNSQNCKYENFNVAEINKLKENPAKFISDYYEAINRKSIKSDDVIQIENLIKGAYPSNIHPAAQEFILNERTKIQASQINSGKS